MDASHRIRWPPDGFLPEKRALALLGVAWVEPSTEKAKSDMAAGPMVQTSAALRPKSHDQNLNDIIFSC